MRGTRFLILGIALTGVGASTASAQVTHDLQAKIDAKMPAIRALAADPAVVQAVKAMNVAVPAEYAQMTQEKWADLSVLDPVVRAFTKNDAAASMKAGKFDEMSEAFVSCAAGTKVAFLSKPTNWSHKGKPKHDGPMSGKAWQGDIETDVSTGVQQIQVAVPVLDGAKPIGSLVVGLAVSKLR